MDKPVFYNNKSLERALQILGTFNSDRPVFALADLAEAVAMPKVTVLRLCSTLVQYDFLRFDRETKKYSLGLKLFELGSVVFGSFSLRRIAAPFLINLQNRLGKSVFLGILQDNELVYIDKRENAQNAIRFGSHIGTRRPPYFGMLGNLLMAYLPEDEVAELLKKHPLTASTRRSVTDEEVFRKRLAVIRSQGYFVDDGEAMEGITGVAAPVRNFTGDVVAGVGVGFISSSGDGREVRRIVREAIRTASEISQAMGHIEGAGKGPHVSKGRQKGKL